MKFQFPFRRRPPVVLVEPVEVPEPPPRPVRALARRVSPALRSGSQALVGALALVDRAFASLAVPFGVEVREPRRRYAQLIGVFALLFLFGAVPVPVVALTALALAYLGVLAIGRAWVLNEKERTAIVKRFKDTDPDALPDLRRSALLSALMLFVLFPLLFAQAERFFGLFRIDHEPTAWSWFWFAIDKTYLKSLPDWSVLYGVHVSSIDFAPHTHWGRHLVMLSRLTFDYILIQGILRLLAIRATVREAVAVVAADPHVAVRLGQRAVGPLLDRLHDPDRAVRGAAANALTQLGAYHALQEALGEGHDLHPHAPPHPPGPTQ